MIATLRGEITQIEDNALVMEIGGVGLRVFVPTPLRGRMKVGEAILLYTHLVVREDALTLYGFETQTDRDLFNMLLGVDGVGPKVSLSVLSTLTLDTGSVTNLCHAHSANCGAEYQGIEIIRSIYCGLLHPDRIISDPHGG